MDSIFQIMIKRTSNSLQDSDLVIRNFVWHHLPLSRTGMQGVWGKPAALPSPRTSLAPRRSTSNQTGTGNTHYKANSKLGRDTMPTQMSIIWPQMAAIATIGHLHDDIIWLQLPECFEASYYIHYFVLLLRIARAWHKSTKQRLQQNAFW